MSSNISPAKTIQDIIKCGTVIYYGAEPYPYLLLRINLNIESNLDYLKIKRSYWLLDMSAHIRGLTC